MSKSNAVVTAKENESGLNSTNRSQERAADGIAKIAESIHQNSDAAKEYVDEKVTNIEGYVGEKASEIGEFSRRKLDSANSIGHRTAEILENSSEKLRNADFDEAKDRVVTTLRERPEIGILSAGAFGLLLGYLVGKRRRG